MTRPGGCRATCARRLEEVFDLVLGHPEVVGVAVIIVVVVPSTVVFSWA